MATKDAKHVMEIAIKIALAVDDCDNDDACRAIGSLASFYLAAVDDVSFESWIEMLRLTREAQRSGLSTVEGHA